MQLLTVINTDSERTEVAYHKHLATPGESRLNRVHLKCTLIVASFAALHVRKIITQILLEGIAMCRLGQLLIEETQPFRKYDMRNS